MSVKPARFKKKIKIQTGNKNGAYTDLSQAAKLGHQDAKKVLATLGK